MISGLKRSSKRVKNKSEANTQTESTEKQENAAGGKISLIEKKNQYLNLLSNPVTTDQEDNSLLRSI